MGRAPCCAKVGLKKGRWTAEEDQTLVKYINENGEGSWRSLPKNAGLLRCGKSCRLRWINYLRADLKRGNISKEEEELIVKLHATLGNRWSLIAGHLPGRTDNEIKNYWNSHLSRKIDGLRRAGGSCSDGDGEATTTTVEPSGKRRSGRISRWTTATKKTTKEEKTKEKAKEKTKEKTKENGIIEKETHDISSNSVAQSDEWHSMVLDPEQTQASSGTIEGPEYEIISGLLSPSVMDSGLLELSNDIELEEMEAMFLDGSDQERDSGAVMSTRKEREGGAMVLNSGEGESGPMGLIEGGEDGIVMGQSEIMGQLEGGFQVAQALDWDLERLEAELLDGVGEMWAWHGEDHGYQEEDSFASWFLSDAL